MSGGSYASCDGTYELTFNQENGSPVYLNNQNNRVLALYGDRWACRNTRNGLPTGTYLERSKYR